jgi:hypothetical protein
MIPYRMNDRGYVPTAFCRKVGNATPAIKPEDVGNTYPCALLWKGRKMDSAGVEVVPVQFRQNTNVIHEKRSI